MKIRRPSFSVLLSVLIRVHLWLLNSDRIITLTCHTDSRALSLNPQANAAFFINITFTRLRLSNSSSNSRGTLLVNRLKRGFGDVERRFRSDPPHGVRASRTNLTILSDSRFDVRHVESLDGLLTPSKASRVPT